MLREDGRIRTLPSVNGLMHVHLSVIGARSVGTEEEEEVRRNLRRISSLFSYA